MQLFLYGPPITGKSTLGQSLAARLEIPFHDLDHEIEAAACHSIAEIFQLEGETGFRQRELAALSEAVEKSPRVIALGGGALLNPKARELAERNGQILCLEATLETLLDRHNNDTTERPLLVGDLAPQLEKLLDVRGEHYQSFPLRLDTNQGSIDDLTWQAQMALGTFRVRGMGQAYDVRISPGSLHSIGRYCQDRHFNGPMVVVSDEQVGALHGAAALKGLRDSGYEASLFCISPGEENKNIHTILKIWDYFIAAGIERSSTVIALGGGVVGDMTGFAAASFLRGVPWVNIPTTLLSMVDSSLGGKTGIDLPQAKNMVGAFYPPRLVLADPLLLETLPEQELRNGLAEVVKHGVIGDPDLYSLCAAGPQNILKNMDQVVRRGMVVKIKVIESDPYEKGLRQGLNLGHTIGHGVEITSRFRLSHGEAVAIGMVAEARIAGELGLAEPGLYQEIATVLAAVGLPTRIPDDIAVDKVIQAMRLDKKRAAGKIHFALPIRIGEVRTGVIVEDWPQRLQQSLRSAP